MIMEFMISELWWHSVKELENKGIIKIKKFSEP